MRSFLARMPQSLAAAVLAAVATAAIIGGYSATFASHDSTTIHACVAKRSGAVRIVSAPTDCETKTENAVEWNKQGVPGTPGPQGPQGETGPAGTIESLEALNGIPCASNGVLSTNIGAGGEVSLSCVLPPPETPTCPPPTPDYPNSTATCNQDGSWVIACWPSFQDLNGVVTDGCEAYDGDGDTYYSPAANNEDCNDANASVHPGAIELANTVDDDCDGLVNEGFGVQLAIDPTWEDFWAGDSTTFTVTNQGGLTATGLNIFLSGNEFGFYSVSSTTCAGSLAAAATCEIVVSYTAPFGSQDGALLTIQDDTVPAASSATATLEGMQ